MAPPHRKIPEATVARLPLYLRSLLEGQHAGLTTISSERLAELAGVNAAKVRKDLSYLGSYGTRGVGYDVEYLLFQMSRELGLTQDWPVVIVGLGNLGQALANYGGFGDRGFPIAALVDADPNVVGTEVHGIVVRSIDDLPAGRAGAQHRHRHHRHARVGRPGRRRPARRRRRPVDPELRADGDLGARRGLAPQGRPRRGAADPELLPAAPSRRSAGRRRCAELTARPPRGAASHRAASTSRCYPVNLLVAGRRVLVVGGGRGGGREGRAACSRPVPSCTSWPRRSATRSAADGRHLGGAPLRARRGGRLPAGGRLPPTTRRSTRPCSTTARPPGCG